MVEMNEQIWFLLGIALGIICGGIIVARYYQDIVLHMTKQNIELVKKLNAAERKPATEREIEYFRRGGKLALQTVCNFASHRLEIDPSKFQEVMDD